MLYDKNFYLTAFLLVIFALSTWLDVNGVWVELPLIVNQAPEGWALPSYLTLAIALSNIGPLIIVLLKLRFKKRLDERIFIYIEIIVGIISCALIAQHWNTTSYVAGRQRSVFFLTLVFLLGTLDTTSTVTYADYMKRYHAKLLNALYLGESLTSLVPSILASIQGVGGEAICRANSTYPEYSSPRFSVQVYFWTFVAIILLSLIAFLFLEFSSVTKLQRRSNTTEFSEQTEFTSDTGTTIKSHYHYLWNFTFNWNLCCIAIFSTSLLYLHILNILTLTILFLFATFASIYVIIVAALSPCPPLHDSTGGAILVIVLGNRIRQEYPYESGLFWFGASSQFGSLIGAIPMYLLINVYNLFQSRNVCQTYC
ncbi:hypothetical protein I4U23_029409 [Adineta vaga]|nr:hypothetical protein I4U23_029409 [Adineta vaga]